MTQTEMVAHSEEIREAWRKASRKYSKAHPERVRQKNRERRTTSAGKVRESSRKWRDEHPGYAHEWYEAHREQVAEQARKWEAEHSEQRRERAREYRQSHREQAREYQRQYYKAHPGQAIGYVMKWQATERGRLVCVAASARRRVRLSDIVLTADTVLDLRLEYGGICPYCNKTIRRGHIDHVVPVCKGGTNERSNLVWVCAECNRQKHSMGLLQFMLYRRNLEGAAQ